MRAAPTCQISLRRFGVWRSAVLALAALGVAGTAAWLFTREAALLSPGSIAAVCATGLIAAAGASLTKMTAVDLRWDGLIWHLGPPAGEPIAGHVGVAIDLGAWMLLRFAPASPQARPRLTWLPVQRHGLEPQWHALRCAVYSPRPAPAQDTPGDF